MKTPMRIGLVPFSVGYICWFYTCLFHPFPLHTINDIHSHWRLTIGRQLITMKSISRKDSKCYSLFSTHASLISSLLLLLYPCYKKHYYHILLYLLSYCVSLFNFELLAYLHAAFSPRLSPTPSYSVIHNFPINLTSSNVFKNSTQQIPHQTQTCVC